MKRVQNQFLALTAVGFFAVATLACDARRDEPAPQTDEVVDTRDDTPDAERTGHDTAFGAAMETFDVQMALRADDTVDASDINVDTLHETRTVVLSGSVQTEEQKTEAARIAAREAEGYRVDNQLVVKPRP